MPFRATLLVTLIMLPLVFLNARVDPSRLAARDRPASNVIAVTEVVGYSFKGKPIQMVSIGEGPVNLLYVGVFHGNESNGKFTLQKLIEYLKNRPELLSGKRVLIVPVVNPDGLDLGTRVNRRGVDLNRNFPTRDWKKYYSSKKYNPGTRKPEPETRVIISLIQKYEPKMIISIHNPLRCINYDGPSAGLAAEMSRYNHYPVRSYIGYQTPGSFGRYAGKERNISFITLELSRTGWEKAWEYNKEALLVPLTFLPETNVNSSPTNLYQAAKEGNIPLLKTFLQAGADPNTRDSLGWTALMAASGSGRDQAVQILLEKGADVNLFDSTGWTALMAASQYNHTNVVKILLNKGANIQAKDMFESTAFLEAAKNGNKEIVKMLLDRCASPEERDSEDRTALHYAARFGYLNTAKILIDAGADVNALDSYGRTALIDCAYFGYTEMIVYLLAHGANPRIRDVNNRTALAEAYRQENFDSARLLKKAKSRLDALAAKTMKVQASGL